VLLGGGIHVVRGGALELHAHRVKEMFWTRQVSKHFQTRNNGCGGAVNAFGDSLQTIWSVIHAVKCGNVCQQRLRGANIAGGFVAANMLLARLNGKPKRWTTRGIAADTN